VRKWALIASLIAAASAAAQAVADAVAGPEYRGEQVTCDLPESLHLWNKGSDRDGAGMCVMTSIETAGIYQNVPGVRGLRDWCAREPGGAGPPKVADQLRRYFAAKGLPVPPYVQYEGADPGPVMELADRTGRMICTTYGYSPRYGKTIYHMVCAARFRGLWGVVLDNNPVGIGPGRLYEWLESAELIRRAKHPQGKAWVFVWLTPPPPPAPHN
jgi:hypothetical protein